VEPLSKEIGALLALLLASPLARLAREGSGEHDANGEKTSA
jgi:hypothetical protein